MAGGDGTEILIMKARTLVFNFMEHIEHGHPVFMVRVGMPAEKAHRLEMDPFDNGYVLQQKLHHCPDVVQVDVSGDRRYQRHRQTGFPAVFDGLFLFFK